MNSKKMVFAVFLGLLASAAALISALFMLLHLKPLATLPAQVDNLKNAISAISTDIDVSPINERIDDVIQRVNDLGQEVDTLKANESVTVNEPDTDDNAPTTPQTPATTEPDTTDGIETPDTTEPVQPTETKPETPVDTDDKPKAIKTTDRVNVRKQPGLKGSVVKTTNDGTSLTLLGETTIKDGYTWVKVKDSNGTIGWVAQRYTN